MVGLISPRETRDGWIVVFDNLEDFVGLATMFDEDSLARGPHTRTGKFW